MKDIKGVDIEVGQQAVFIDTKYGKIFAQRVTVTKVGQRVSGVYLGQKWNRSLNKYELAQVTIVRIPSHIFIL